MTTINLNGLSIDRTLSATDNWLALLNTVSTYVYTGNEFTLGVPSGEIPTDPLELSNTQITLIATPNTEFLGSKTLRYLRLTLGQTKAGSSTNYAVATDAQYSDAVEQIMSDHNLVNSEIIIDGVMPSPGQTTVWTLTASPTSLLYIGQIGVTVTMAADT